MSPTSLRQSMIQISSGQDGKQRDIHAATVASSIRNIEKNVFLQAIQMTIRGTLHEM
jgi:hypothetical protein